MLADGLQFAISLRKGKLGGDRECFLASVLDRCVLDWELDFRAGSDLSISDTEPSFDGIESFVEGFES